MNGTGNNYKSPKKFLMHKEQETAAAIVLFTNSCGPRWLRALRQNFRHCFIVVQSQEYWVICDPLLHFTNLAVLKGMSCNEIAEWYRDQGMIAVVSRVRRAQTRTSPIRLHTCVESVKRILGIHSPWILTPWQLYKFLQKSKQDKVLAF